RTSWTSCSRRVRRRSQMSVSAMPATASQRCPAGGGAAAPAPTGGPARAPPALWGRDAAAGEPRAARGARERSRAELPPDLADAGAERLAVLERQLRQELGGLEAARRAERRADEIGRERTALDRQARADDELLRDAADWLGGWDATRRRCQERIEQAQDAVARAEHLAGRLEPARRRLDAARRRDVLAGRVTAAEDRLRAARDGAVAARETWLDLKERRLLGIAAELAAGLREGEECAVCGSTAHPKPARAAADQVDRTAEEAAYEAHGRAEATRADAERALAAVREDLSLIHKTDPTRQIYNSVGVCGGGD
ncbi:hypothetical protein ACWGH9_37140, partial [Streptomyces chryseus]